MKINRKINVSSEIYDEKKEQQEETLIVEMMDGEGDAITETKKTK